MKEEKDTAYFDAYDSAIVRIATCMASGAQANVPLLVFASLEFVHRDRPFPDSMPLDSKGLPAIMPGAGSSGLRVYFRRVAMKASDALDWYIAALSGKLTIPVPNNPEDRGRFDGTPLRSPRHVEEPLWPQLAFPITDQSLFGGGAAIFPVPFLGPGSAPARIHRLMAAADPDLDALSRDQTACNWLTSRIHFRIDDYSELLGSIVLVAPDPQISRVTQFFARNAGKNEKLVTQVQPRTRQKLENLHLTVFEERFGAISTFQQLTVPSDGIIVREAPATIRASGYMLGHNTRGLIDFQPPTSFVRTIGLSTEVASRRVKLQARETRKKDAEIKEYEVGEYVPGSESLIGETALPLDAHARFSESAQMRQARSLGRQSDQRWIDDPNSARAFLRGLIGNARREIFVADCFFNGEELASYLHFVRRLHVRIRILTSKEIFAHATDKSTPLKEMNESLSTFQNRGIKDIHVRVMKNKDGGPILHDRFLIVDGAAWFSGNSLNSLGQRESLIIKLPNPKPVIERLHEIFEAESDPLSTFSAE